MMLMKLFRAFTVSVLLLWAILGGATAAPRPGRVTTAIEQLGLSGDQKSKLRDYIDASRLGTQKDRSAIAAERQRLMDQYCRYNLNVVQAKNSITRINRLQLDLLNRRLDRRLRVRSVLTPDQFVKFRRLMDRMPRSPKRMDDELPPGGAPRGGQLPRLNLSPSQQQQIQKMWGSEQAEHQRILQSMTRDLQSMEQVFASYRVDERAARRLIVSVNKSQLQVLQLRHDRQMDLRRIITEPQFQALTQHIKRSPQPGLRRGPRDR
jgi:Spy/CpxP family protein refolding chaperone